MMSALVLLAACTHRPDNPTHGGDTASGARLCEKLSASECADTDTDTDVGELPDGCVRVSCNTYSLCHVGTAMTNDALIDDAAAECTAAGRYWDQDGTYDCDDDTDVIDVACVQLLEM